MDQNTVNCSLKRLKPLKYNSPIMNLLKTAILAKIIQQPLLNLLAKMYFLKLSEKQILNSNIAQNKKDMKKFLCMRMMMALKILLRI